jgi:hypothetical protein
MKVTHVMADGSIRESVAGLVITADRFYDVLRTIAQKQTHNEQQKG